MRKKVKNLLMSIIVFTLFPAIANAGIAPGGTRLIYDASKNSAAIDVLNTDQQIYLIQSWEEGADKTPVPFVLTPPLYKINKKSAQFSRGDANALTGSFNLKSELSISKLILKILLVL